METNTPLPPLTRSIAKPSIGKIWYSTIVASLSSFFFGFCLTASEVYIKAFETKKGGLLSSQKSWFMSINLLGALVGNLIICNFHLNRKLIISFNNFLYGISVLIISFAPSAMVLCTGKFIMGLGIGVTCAYIPAYLTELSPIKTRGLIGSFHQLFITLGVLTGYLFDSYFKDKGYLGIQVICTFLLGNFILCLFISQTISIKKGVGIIELLNNRNSWKSVFLASLFNFTQQASGVNVIVICAHDLLKDVGTDPKNKIYIGLSQLLTTIIATGFVEKVGRKPLMAVSVGGVTLALALMTFTKFRSFYTYFFMAAFALGLGPVTWFIAGDIVPPESRNAVMQVASSFNWIFAFVTVVSQSYLFQVLGEKMFLIYLSIMVIYFVYIIVFFEETRGRVAKFL